MSEDHASDDFSENPSSLGVKDSQLAFLQEGSPTPFSGETTIAARREAALRGIDAEFLLEIVAPFAQVPETAESEGGALDAPSSASFASGPALSPGGTVNFHDTVSQNSIASGAGGVRHYFGRVLIIGPSGSGKTTFKQCVTQVIRYKLPEVQPSAFSASTKYHFSSSATANKPAEKLFIDLVDTGAQQKSPLNRLLRPADLIILTWSLATVKQSRKRAGLLGSHVETAVFHNRDLQELSSIVRDLTVAVPGVPLVVIGTHSDVLSERAAASLEKVVQTLEKHITEAIDAASRGEPGPLQLDSPSPSKAPSPNKSDVSHRNSPLRRVRPLQLSGRSLQPPILLGTYAISCVENKCYGSSGGAHASMNQMWRTVCESILKGARGNAVLRSIDIPRLRFFDSATELLMLADRVSSFLTCLRTEHGVAMLGIHQLAQAFFAFGAPSKKTVESVLRILQHRGDVMMLDRTKEYSKQLLLLPHLPSRVVSAVMTVAQGMKSTIEERVQKSKLVSIEDCVAADTTRELNRGVLKRGVVKHLANCIPADVAQDRTLIFLRVARQIGFLFHLNEGGIKPVTRSLDRVDTNASFLSRESSVISATDKFIVPSLITPVVAPTTIGALRREMNSKRLHSCTRTVMAPLAPSGFLSILHCEVGQYVLQRTHVTRTSVWLTHDNCRCFIVCDRDPASLPDSIEIDLLFFGAVGPGSLRVFALFVADVMQDIIRALKSANIESIAEITTDSSFLSSPPSKTSSQSPNHADPADPDRSALVNVSTASKDDSIASLLRLDLCVAPLSS
jgi:GTPase SAR1 family protein